MHQTNNISSIQLFSEFFHENQEKFLSFAYSYIRDRQEAEDILMESMITLWENRDKWEEDSNLHGLLLTIIKNKALNYLAHLQVRLRAEKDSGTTRYFRQKCGVPHHQSIENSAYRTERLPGFYSFLKIIAFFVRVVQG